MAWTCWSVARSSTKITRRQLAGVSTLPGMRTTVTHDSPLTATPMIAPPSRGLGHEPAARLMPPWSVSDARRWTGQVPYLARHVRVLPFDGRGNGRSDRPGSSEAYADTEFVADALAVMDATGTDRAVLVGMS